MTSSAGSGETPDLDAAADQAAPLDTLLDTLLVDAALGPLRRFAPNLSTATFAARRRIRAAGGRTSSAGSPTMAGGRSRRPADSAAVGWHPWWTLPAPTSSTPDPPA